MRFQGLPVSESLTRRQPGEACVPHTPGQHLVCTHLRASPGYVSYSIPVTTPEGQSGGIKKVPDSFCALTPRNCTSRFSLSAHPPEPPATRDPSTRCGSGRTKPRGVGWWRSTSSGRRSRWRSSGTTLKTGTVLYHSMMHPVLKRNFEVFSACDWLAALTAHIPNAGEHLVRYYGWYSNVNRGKRRKVQGEDSPRIEEGREVSVAAAKRAWARRSAEPVEASSSRSMRRIRWSAHAVAEPCGCSPSSRTPRASRRS